ncbi:hypothetical protein ABZP36_018139 [Zizania latifolia]
MRRHGSDASPSIIHTSSIALLQERFRNLERVKEMREGRELKRAPVNSADAHQDHRAAAGSASSSALGLGPQSAVNGGNEQPRWFLHPDLVRSSRPLHGPSSYQGALGGGGVQASSPSTPATMSPWGGLPKTMQNSGFRGDVDVDTSLHL